MLTRLTRAHSGQRASFTLHHLTNSGLISQYARRWPPQCRVQRIRGEGEGEVRWGQFTAHVEWRSQTRLHHMTQVNTYIVAHRRDGTVRYQNLYGIWRRAGDYHSPQKTGMSVCRRRLHSRPTWLIDISPFSDKCDGYFQRCAWYFQMLLVFSDLNDMWGHLKANFVR